MDVRVVWLRAERRAPGDWSVSVLRLRDLRATLEAIQPISAAGPEPTYDVPELAADQCVVEKAVSKVWRALGAGHYENVYRSALCVALAGYNSKWAVREEVSVPVLFESICVGTGRADIVWGSDVVLELKTVAKLKPEHEAQLQCYLRGLQGAYGFLVNFPPVGGDAVVVAVSC